jgi:iron(III) transport system ATP-binding protein
MVTDDPPPPPQLELRAIRHAYGDHEVVSGLSLALPRGAIGCLLGPSACGKTTVLRGIAGFEPVTGGEIVIEGRRMSAPGLTMPPEQRQVGMVFQDYALFPHLTVARNIGFGLRAELRGERERRVEELLDAVGLRPVAARFPHELSGGQQQRVALARALAPRPRLLLLDEPFSNLDVELRERLAPELRALIKRTGTTVVLVTHDQHEAFNLADVVGLMRAGRIEQWDTPYDLYHRPATRFVADFIGQGTFLPGTIVGPRTVEVELGVLTLTGSTWPVGTPVDVLLRPDDVLHDDASPLRAQVLHKAFRGAEFLYTLALPHGARVLSLVPSHHNHAIGEPIGIRLEVDHVVAFPTAAAAAA